MLVNLGGREEVYVEDIVMLLNSKSRKNRRVKTAVLLRKGERCFSRLDVRTISRRITENQKEVQS